LHNRKGPVGHRKKTIYIVAIAVAFLTVAGFSLANYQENQPAPATFTPISKEWAQTQFGHVVAIQVTMGRFSLPYLGAVTVQLSPSEQRQLYDAILKARVQSGGTIPSEGMLYQIGFQTQGGGGYSGPYSDDGRMLTDQSYAPNPAFAAFFNKVAGPALNQWMIAHGKRTAATPDQEALNFANHLVNPVQAYRYCIPQLSFVNPSEISFNILKTDAQALHGARYAVTGVRYGVGDSAAVATVTPTKGHNDNGFQIRMDRMGTSWIITAIGNEIHFDNSFATPGILQPFGKHHVVVIGKVAPPQMQNTRMTMVSPTHVSAASLAGADIIVWERKGIRGPVHQQLPGKFTQGRPDPRAVAALQDDPAFRIALSRVKTGKADLVIVGDADHLLSIWLIQHVLHVKPGMIVMHSGGFQSVILSYAHGQPQFQDGGEIIENGKALPLSTLLLQTVLNNVEILRDTGGL